MKKIFLLILFLFACGAKTFALEIVYPKTNPVKINANSTFFIGSVNPNEKLKINDVEVKTSPNGAFAQMIQLNAKINNFKIKTETEEINFVIERAQPSAAPQKTQPLIEYPAIIFYVKNDNVPLRMTPVNSGINRMSHLNKDTRVLINGEKGDFYRVFLNTKLSGWIAKSDVEQREKLVELIKIKELKLKEDKDFCYWEFELNGKVPFTLKEENGLQLQLFNVDGCEDNTYCLTIPSKKLMGYDAYYDKDRFILKVRKTPVIDIAKPLKDITIAVDAGHGGCENGAIGGCGDKEKDINLVIAKNLKEELEERGAKVVMTREDDVQISLKDRVQTAKDKEAVLLISIHANALPDGQDPIKNRGTSVYYYHNQAKSLAENILNEMTAQLKTQNDKVRQGSLALVRPTSSVSVLIEAAYIINPDDYMLLLNKDFQKKCAKAIADGIEKYILN
jgi:N-acetylmuramoyl-L-alanine amidase